MNANEIFQEQLKEFINLPSFKARDKENQQSMLKDLLELMRLTPAKRKFLERVLNEL